MSAEQFEAIQREAGDVYPLGSTTITELTGGLKSGQVLFLSGAAASGKTEVGNSMFEIRQNILS
jgi:tRNA A37 threonylcarbamoyladenosine biosynthesis protein TsaE